MAAKRMFSKSITNSSLFLMMPQSSQNLYFHLGMNADDDGFCEHFTIMRMTESKPDDLKILQAKNFVYVFDDKVLIILDWKENNLIRCDRYTPSKYLDIYKAELSQINSGIPLVSIGKDRLGKVRLGKDREEAIPKRFKEPSLQEIEEYVNIKAMNVDPVTFFNYFHVSNWIDSKGNKVKNWKQKIITWDSHSKGKKQFADKTNMQEALELKERLESYES